MKPTTVMVWGTVNPDGTVVLDDKPNVSPGRVRVTIERVAEPDKPRVGLLEVLDRIHAEQRERGHRPMTEEEMEAELAASRAEDEEYERRW